jgi:hypothetical protein
MTPATTTPAAKRLIEEHEPANLAAFKGKLRALLTEHTDVAPDLGSWCFIFSGRPASIGRMIGSGAAASCLICMAGGGGRNEG